MQQNNITSLHIKNIKKYINNKKIVDGIDIKLDRGEIVGLFGPNGAGKTTCFYMICGLISADQGNIYLGPEKITNLPMYRRANLGISYLPQDASIFRGMTVRENILSIVELHEQNEDRIDTTVNKILSDFAISHIAENSAITLSGGERRRVEIARCIASKPKYILLDEPLAGIDPIAVNEIKFLLSELKKRNIGILITDHNVRDTLSLIDRAYIIYGGKVLAHGNAKEIIANKDVCEVYLGSNFNL